MAVGAARATVRRREPGRRLQQSRHRAGGARARRRIHAHPAQRRERHQRIALRQAELQRAARPRPGGIVHARAQRDGGQSDASGQYGPRVHRLREGQSRKGLVCLLGRRHDASHVRRTVQGHGRNRHSPRPLSRPRGGRLRRPHDRHGARDLRNLPPSLELIRAGKLRALAVTSTTRSQALPELPTVADFLPGYEASAWYGIAAPAGTPAVIVERLNQELNAAFADPKMKARIAELGGTPLPGSPADFAKLFADETEKWAKVVKLSGAKAD